MMARAAVAIRIRYLVAGLVLGVAWSWHAGESPWKHVLRLAIVVLILAPILRLAPQFLGIRRTRTRTRTRAVSWPRLLAVKLPLIGLALLAEWGLRHWMSATDSGLITAAALAAAVAMLGPVLHSRLFPAAPGVPAAAGAGPDQRGPRSRRRFTVRAGGMALVLLAGFALRHLVVYGILSYGLTSAGLAVEAAAGAVVVALGAVAWARRRRPAVRHATAHLNEARMSERPVAEEDDYAAAQHLADHVRPAPGRRDGLRRRPGSADPAH